MQRLRFWLVVLFLWFLAVSNIERYHEPINLASFTYVMTGAVVIIVLAFPVLHRLSLLLATLLPLPPYFLLKLYLGYNIFGQHLPLTVTEIASLELTILLARRVSESLEDFRSAVAYMMTAHVNNPCNSFEAGQDHIYREVHRARHYKRPLAMLAIAPDDKTVSRSLPRFVEEVQNATIHKYVVAKIAELLSEQMKQGDIITQRDGHFITLLPESNREKAQRLAERLNSTAKKELGIDLCFGVASFPDEEITFEGLLERAEHEMRQECEPATTDHHHLNGNGRKNGAAVPTNGDAGAHSEPAAAAASTSSLATVASLGGLDARTRLNDPTTVL